MINLHHSLKPKLALYLILVLILLFALSACSSPTPDPGNPPATEPVQSAEEVVPDSPAPSSDTAVLPTITPSPNPTATPLPTLTSTPAPMANITGNTNCRTGPGSVYDLLHTYLAGNQVKLLGKSPDDFFWYTRASSEYAPDCWLWGKYVTPVGDTELLPVFTPPPTPTPSPDFVITYFHADVGAGQFHFFFEIENIGNVTWESALLYIFDPVVPQEAGRFSNNFQVNGTLPIPTKDSIPAGDIGYFHSEQLSNPGAYGKQPDVLDIYFVACTEEYLNGYCITKMWTEKLW